MDGLWITNLIKYHFFIDVLFGRFKWRARHQTSALNVVVTDSINAALVAMEQLMGPLPHVKFSTSLTTKLCELF